MDKETFIDELKKLNINITELQLNQLDKYYQLLVEWNNKVNLTRIIEEKDVYLKHFYDSITLVKAAELSKTITLCDIGTGAGFPGIVIKIVFPTLSITLVDSLLKRINFLNLVIKELKLENIIAIHSRAEDFVKYNKNKYDLVTCRAVSKLYNLIPYSIPLLKKGGYFIPMKANCADEIDEAKNIINKYNAKIESIIEFKLPFENSNRTLIKICKNVK